VEFGADIAKDAGKRQHESEPSCFPNDLRGLHAGIVGAGNEKGQRGFPCCPSVTGRIPIRPVPRCLRMAFEAVLRLLGQV